MSTHRSVDWSLYVVTDSRITGERSLVDTVAAAVRGGAGVVQYREKHASTRVMLETARALSEVCRTLGAVFLINDRIDIALAVDADGVHVGQDDMPSAVARRLLGPTKLIGVTVHNRQEIEKAEREGVDYLSIAPVFATTTKPDHQKPLGLEGMKVLAREARLPVVAISGIKASNAADVIRCGVQGVCVVSAVIGAPDPERAARDLLSTVQSAR